jgi:signal transduction histidine kinase/CheY-like chemotaxis protein
MTMRRVFIIVYSALAFIMLVNFFFYKSLYNKQINYITGLLKRQVQIVGIEVDSINNTFVSDLNQINFTPTQDLTKFFDKTKPEFQLKAIEELKIFYSKYKEFVSKIRVYDNRLNEYTLLKDEEGSGWIEQEFIVLDQRRVVERDSLDQSNREFNYYATILTKKSGVPVGNILVTVDYKKFFQNLFSEFNLKDYQWQWVVNDAGGIVYDNNPGVPVTYSRLDNITKALSNGSNSNITHQALIKGKKKEIISAYYSSNLLGRELGLIFSAPTELFQRYLVRNSLFIVLGTLLIIQLIISIFLLFIRSQKSRLARLSDSESMLMKLVEEMPVGVIIHNNNREILKANKVAAELYSYTNESDMLGKIFPETTLPDDNEYFSRYLGGKFQPDHFVIIKKEIGEKVLNRSSIPVKFNGIDCTLDILIDVTLLESARKQEAKANIAKSEFLARMSYEIRTPLNGIIGMADVLNKYDLSADVRSVISLLRKSTEVLLGIINDILDFSKIESGKMILDEVPFDLREEINYSLALAKTNTDEKGIIIKSVIDEKVPESIIGDPFRLRQVLTNLINQSIRNCEKGEIYLRCRIHGKIDGIIILVFEIQDTGKSLTRAALKKIFGDFLGADSLSLRSNDDLGFGTIIARQLIELMGGELQADSQPEGSGNKITFTIKTYSNERPRKGLDFSNITRMDQIHSLIISGRQNRDEELLAAVHKIGLNSSVTTFQKSTVNQVRTNLSFPTGNYKLIIISDEEDFDGFEVAKKLWEGRLSLNLIIIIVSSNDKKGNYLRSINLGVDHYMVKPIEANELRNVIVSSFPFVENPGNEAESDISKNDLQILLVEDNKMNQIIMAKMLEVLGYSFDIAEDGYEGYSMAISKKYDVIFMDIIMPEMDGYESARRILEADKSNLIVAFTADNMPETRMKAELSGIKEFISKPLRIDELKKLFAKYFS